MLRTVHLPRLRQGATDWADQDLISQSAVLEDRLVAARSLSAHLNGSLLVYLTGMLAQSIFARAHPDWLRVRLEDLSLSPNVAWRKVFTHVFGREAAERLQLASVAIGGGASRAVLPSKAKGSSMFSIARDSFLEVFDWTTQMSAAEASTVRQSTRLFALARYPEDFWWSSDAQSIDKSALRKLPYSAPKFRQSKVRKTTVLAGA